MRSDAEKSFKRKYRMSVGAFDSLVSVLRPELETDEFMGSKGRSIPRSAWNL